MSEKVDELDELFVDTILVICDCGTGCKLTKTVRHLGENWYYDHCWKCNKRFPAIRVIEDKSRRSVK